MNPLDRIANEAASRPIIAKGYEHYLRMNAKRVGRSATMKEFLTDISSRIGGHRNRDNWSKTGGLIPIEKYLTERLTPGRLTLPEGYDLGDR